MWRLVVMMALTAGPVWAQTWSVLTGDQITAALSERVLAYGDGSTQNFHADGATSYDTGSTSLGHWRVQADQYCSQWPPSDRWDCYGVEAEAAGLDLRFVSRDGTRSEARYIDLN